MLTAPAAASTRTLARACTLGTTPAAVLHPAIAEAARQAGASAVGLVDVGCAAGFGLLVDRVGITYDDGRSVGDPAAPVRLPAAVVGDHPVPTRPVPDVVARVGLDRDPVDVTDPDEARRLRAVAADDPERAGRLDAEIALAASVRPVLLPGDPVARLSEALDLVPADALAVVTTTWALSRFAAARRHRFVRRLHELAGGRPTVWVSVEGVGVAPGVPTLGDRPASGHSIVGLDRVDGTGAEALGRCWSRGRWLSWFAAPG